MKNNVKKYRKQLEMTQVDLARVAKVGRSSVSEIESGKRIPYVDTAIYISDALKTTVEKLFIVESMEVRLMSNNQQIVCRDIAQIALDAEIIKGIPENDDALVFVVNQLLEHI